MREKYREMEDRLRREANLNVPVRLLLCHGWSPGPGLPHSLLVSDLYDILEIPSGGICSIVTNLYGLLLVSLLVGYLIIWASVYPAHKSQLVKYMSIPLILILWMLKKMAVNRTIDLETSHLEKQIRNFRPHVVVAYSWGGIGLAGAIGKLTWLGPSLLLATAQDMLAGHGSKPPPNLRHACEEGAIVTIVHGKYDQVVAFQDSQRLYSSANASTRCEFIIGPGDSHFLQQIARPETMNSWIVNMIIQHAREGDTYKAPGY